MSRRHDTGFTASCHLVDVVNDQAKLLQRLAVGSRRLLRCHAMSSQKQHDRSVPQNACTRLTKRDHRERWVASGGGRTKQLCSNEGSGARSVEMSFHRIRAYLLPVVVAAGLPLAPRRWVREERARIWRQDGPQPLPLLGRKGVEQSVLSVGMGLGMMPHACAGKRVRWYALPAPAL